jgi:hypothetical protein
MNPSKQYLIHAVDEQRHVSETDPMNDPRMVIHFSLAEG